MTRISITKTKRKQHHEHYNVQKSKCPLTDTAAQASSATTSGAGAGHTTGKQSDAAGSPETLRDIQPLRYVLRGCLVARSAKNTRAYRYQVRLEQGR